MTWPSPSIRLRLTAWYSVVLVLMLVIYAGTTYWAVRHEFFEQLEDQLRDDFEAAHGDLAPAADGTIAWASDRDHDPDHDEDRGIDVWTASGEPIYRSDAARALPPAALAAATAAARYDSLDVNGRTWRTLTDCWCSGCRWSSRWPALAVTCWRDAP